MNSDSYIDPDFPTKQSAGYMFVRLFCVQLVFMALYALLLFMGEEDTLNLPIANLSTLDIDLILLGVIANFALFLIVFALWQATEYRVSPKRLYIERGFLALRMEQEIKLADINRSVAHVNWLGRIFNYGTVEVFLNGSSIRSIRLRGIPFPNQFRALLNAELLIARKYKKP